MHTLDVRSAAGTALVLTAILAVPSASHAQTQEGRVTAGVSYGTQGTSPDVSTRSVLTVNEEDGELAAEYAGSSGSLLDAGVAVRIWSGLSFGVSVSRASGDGDVDVQAAIPHPFFFDQPRNINGTRGGLKRQETGVHVQLGWRLPVGDALAINVFAGPTFYDVRRDLVTDVDYAETYPFDTATFTAATVTGASKSTVGFNAGADVTYYFGSAFGVGAVVRFSRGEAELPVPGGTSVSVDVGGFQAGAGLRLRF